MSYPMKKTIILQLGQQAVEDKAALEAVLGYRWSF